MIPWTEFEMRQMERERQVRRVEQTYWMQVEPPAAIVDRWQWRVMNKLGSWLVESGCRLQMHAERARQVVRTSPMAMGAHSNSTQPRP